MRKTLLQSFLFIFVLASFSFAQNPSSGKTAEILDEYLTRMAAFGFSGAVVIEKDSRIILQKGYGFANREKQIPFTADTPYPVQSISKQFTAAAILKLEEQGKLKVEDPITKFFKDVPEDKKAVTLHHLLTNSSGLNDTYSGANIFDRDQAVQAILNQPLGNSIGEKTVYSNDGFELLAAIVEMVAKQDFPKFVRRNFFIPARIETGGFQGEGHFWKTEVAHAYNSFADNGSPQFRKPDWDGYGAGDVVISANDLYKWELALRKGKVLSNGIKEKMFRPHSYFRPKWHYGYGWFIIESDRGTTEFYHGGGDIPRGYTASFTRYPSENMTIIIFTNEMIDEMGFLRAVKEDITNIAFGKNVEMPPDFDEKISLPPKKYEGFYKTENGEKFVVRAVNGQLLIGAVNQRAIDFLTFPESAVAENLEKYSRMTVQFVEKTVNDKTAVSPFRANFEGLEEKYGKFKNFDLLGTYPVSENYKISTTYMKLTFENGEEVVRFVRRGDNPPYTLTGNPFPALTPIKPQNRNQFIAYYPFLKKSVQLEFKADEKGEIIRINLKTKEQTASAEADKSN